MRSYPVQNLPRPRLGQGGGFDCCTRPDGTKHCYQNCEERWVDQSTAVYPPCGADGKPSGCGSGAAAAPAPPQTPFGTPTLPAAGGPALPVAPPAPSAPPAPGTAPWSGFHAEPGGKDSVYSCPLPNGTFGLLYADNPSRVAAGGVDSSGLSNFNVTPLAASDSRCMLFAAQNAAAGQVPQIQPPMTKPPPTPGGLPIRLPTAPMKQAPAQGGLPIQAQPAQAPPVCPLGPIPLAKWVESCPGFQRSARF